MTFRTPAILSTGMVSSVGLTAPASCAAIRAKATNPSETRFKDSGGGWIMAHVVPLDEPWRGRTRLAKMAVLAIEECLEDIPRSEWTEIPLILCVAEPERPGRAVGIDEELAQQIQQELAIEFAQGSLTLPYGRVSVGSALDRARRMLAETAAPYVLIVATDSLVSGTTMSGYLQNDRLLVAENSNGFMPGEGAAALLIGGANGQTELACLGLGFATEAATIEKELPLRGEGLTTAIKGALVDAGLTMQEVDFRIADLSGEQYYFKEAALALTRTLRARKEHFDLWHPAECIGETGAVGGLATIVVAHAACHKGYALGPTILCHSAGDSGQRAAAILQLRAP